MIIEETINGLLFQEQKTFYIYRSEQDRIDGNYILCTSDEKKFLANKKLAQQKQDTGDSNSKFIVF